jgi:hypothetical protein
MGVCHIYFFSEDITDYTPSPHDATFLKVQGPPLHTHKQYSTLRAFKKSPSPPQQGRAQCLPPPPLKILCPQYAHGVPPPPPPPPESVGRYVCRTNHGFTSPPYLTSATSSSNHWKQSCSGLLSSEVVW